jgi:hypothetical protein
MRIKHLIIGLALIMLAANYAAAQVYTIKAKYSLLSIYTAEYHMLSFDRIDTANNYTVIADLDKKTITDPTDTYSPLAITDIVHEEGSMFYILKVKPSRYVKWRYYRLMVNHQGEPVYIQQTEQQKDRDVKRDTFYTTFTNNLAALSFYQKFTRIKDTVLNEDRSVAYSKINELWRQKWKFADNLVEMRDGYINWTGPGEKHHLGITAVYLVKKQGSDGIRVICTEKEGEFYDIYYMTSDRKIEERQLGPERFISITKVVDSKSLWAAILR